MTDARSPWETSAYDAECEATKCHTQALGCILIVLEGSKGTDIAIRIPDALKPGLPELLRKIARAFEEDAKRSASGPILCPTCSAPFRFFSLSPDGTTAPREPSTGDTGICGGCASFLRFDGPRLVRLMTVEELAELPDALRIALVRARKQIERERDG